jgi:hypothetical protein
MRKLQPLLNREERIVQCGSGAPAVSRRSKNDVLSFTHKQIYSHTTDQSQKEKIYYFIP